MDNYGPKTVEMFNNRRFVFHSRFIPWVIIVINLVFILSQSSNAQEEYPYWTAYFFEESFHFTSCASENDTLWITTLDSGLIKLNKITHEYQIYNLKDYGFAENGAESIAVDKNGNKWLLTNFGLVKFDGINWVLYDSLGKINTVFINPFIKNDDVGNIWVNGADNIAMFDGVNWTIYDRGDSTSLFYEVNTFGFDSLGNIWCATWDNEIYKINEGKRTLYHANDLYEYCNNRSWKSLVIVDIEISKKGIMWFTIRDNFTGWGSLVKIIDESNIKITQGTDDDDDYVPIHPISVVVESDSNIWLGGNEYLTLFDGEDTWRYYTFARGVQDASGSVMTIDEYGNKWARVGISYNNLTPYIVVFREDGVKLSANQDSPIAHIPLSPNPARDYIIATQYLGWDYQIYDLLGNCVQSGLIDADKINISSLPAGFYTVRFYNGGKLFVEKMMKE